MRKFRTVLAAFVAVMMCISCLWVSGAEVYDIATENMKARENEKRIDALLEFSADIDEMISKYMPKDIVSDINDPFTSARIIVKSSEKLDYEGSLAAVSGYNDMHVIQYATSEEAEKACEKYAALDYVKYAEPDRLMSITATPGDDSFLSWGYEEGHVDAFNYNEWLLDYADGLSNLPEITVAVVDTGADIDHPFIEDRLVPGYDFVNNDTNPDDDHDHGTHVSGTIIDGTLPNVKVMPIKVMNSNGRGYESDIALGMEYAYLNGCPVVNMSLGGDGYSQVYADAIIEGFEYGTLFCVASGNDGDNVENHCPGNVEQAYTVAATDSDYTMAPFSNTGSLVDISAPGVSIYSSVVGGGYMSADGTSMATPHVAAAAAMVLSYNPMFTIDEVTEALDDNALAVGLDGGGSGILCLKDMFKYDIVLNVEDGNMHFTSEGDYLWGIDDDCAYSTNGGVHSSVSTLISRMNFGAYQTITFEYKVSSESEHDFLRFYSNDELIFETSGAQDSFETYTYQAGPAGIYELRWEYVKDSGGNAYDDKAYIKCVALYETLSSVLNDEENPESVFIETEGDYPWIIDGDSLKSGNTGVNNSESVLRGEGALQNGVDLEFMYKVDGDSGDKLTFSINNTLLLESDATSGWQQFTYTIPASGIYDFEWVFSKDGAGASGEDAAWLKDLKVHVTLDTVLNVLGGNLDFMTNGDYPWVICNNYAMSGNSSVSYSSSSIMLSITMQEGDILSFRYMVSSEMRYDKLTLLLNGENIFEESGNVDWTTYTYTAESSGLYEFEWVYTKDGSVSSGADAAFLDDVCLTRGSYLPGDADSNGEVTALDALTILRYATGAISQTEIDLRAADFNGDGIVNALDALEVLRYTLS
ncbi:MAG: S8 family serine peptidase [Clostridia bacterium]|nr:S8 family serine peptidase [Clostridia bacterium]